MNHTENIKIELQEEITRLAAIMKNETPLTEEDILSLFILSVIEEEKS